MELEILEAWKVKNWESRKVRCFSMYCSKPTTHFCRVKLGEMEIRLVFCKVHYEEFVKMAKMEVKT